MREPDQTLYCDALGNINLRIEPAQFLDHPNMIVYPNMKKTKHIFKNSFYIVI